jgi:MFS transporter, DHA2 family, multidrug resistance protein
MDRLIGALEGRYGALPGSPDGGHQATLEQLWHLAYREASILAFADAFRTILLVLVVAALLVPLMRKVAAPGPATASSNH